MSHRPWGPKRQARAKRILKRLEERRPDRALCPAAEREYFLPLRAAEELSAAGSLEVRVLRGSLEVLGACLRPSSTFHRIDVPKWLPCVRLRARKVSSPGAKKLKRPATEKAEAEDVLAYLSEHESPVVLCLRFPGAPRLKAGQRPKELIESTLLPPLDRRRFRSHSSWPSLVERLATWREGAGHRVLLVMGPKGVGKSTCCRHIANALLDSCPEVCLLETDVGQPELGPPGMVSLFRLRSPLLRPSHVEQNGAHECLASFFTGAVTPGVHPELYIRCVRAAFDEYLHLAADAPWQGSSPILPPLVVNSLGWVNGLGLELIRTIVGISRPQLVLRIEAPAGQKRKRARGGDDEGSAVMATLSGERLTKQRRPVLLRCGPLALSLGEAAAIREAEDDCAFVVAEHTSLASGESAAGPKPPELRWLRFACNFRPDLGPCRLPRGITLRDFFGQLPRWHVPLASVRFGQLHGALVESEVEAAFTGTLVALCRTGKPDIPGFLVELPDEAAPSLGPLAAASPNGEATEGEAAGAAAACSPATPRIEFSAPRTAPRCISLAFVHSFDLAKGVVVLYTPATVTSLRDVELVLRGDLNFVPSSVRGQEVCAEPLCPSSGPPVSVSPLEPYCSYWTLQGLSSGTRLQSTRRNLARKRLQHR